METKFDFNECFKVSKDSIGVALRFLEKKYGKDSITQNLDRDMKAQFDYGIDFIVKKKNGEKISIDAKMIGKPYYSIFIETMSDLERGIKGNFFTTTANYFLFYWKNGEHEPFLLPINDITRRYVPKLFIGEPHKVLNKCYTTTGYWISINAIKRLISVYCIEQQKLRGW